MFWESDRTKSTFSMLCKPDGTFDFNGARESWPTCLTGNFYIRELSETNGTNADILCDELPPEVPTHEEYTLASDDGTVVINSVIYPTISQSPTTVSKNSSYNNTLIAMNYNANLT